MSITTSVKNHFCPAPWIGLFYQINQAGVCCCSKDMLDMSPNEFKNSEYLATLQQEFLKGNKPKNCSSCWINESQDRQSIRQHFLNRYPNIDLNYVTNNPNIKIQHLELRTSNQCNFQCRMCEPDSSHKLEKELEDHPNLKRFYRNKSNKENNISDNNWKEILDNTQDLTDLFLTGGEPMVMKEYYDLLDYLISSNKQQTISLNIYTNGSTYNPKFIEKLIQFKQVRLNISIDGVGKTAEYQRYGTVWNTVKENIFKFSKLPNTIVNIHSTYTAYTILDMLSLANFYRTMFALNPKFTFQAHTATYPRPLHFLSLDQRLRKIAIEQIDQSLKILQHHIFNNVTKELLAIKQHLISDDVLELENFVAMTLELDQIRNQTFEETFGYKLITGTLP